MINHILLLLISYNLITTQSEPFRPHHGLKKKVQMCVVCTMSINMQKQTAIAAKQMKADLATNIDRSRKQQLKDKMADKLAQKGKKDTGDPNYMSPNPFLLPKKEQNPKRMAKDKALMSCLSLPAVAKQICLTKIKASMPPYAPTAVVPNPAKYAGVFDGQKPLPDTMVVRESSKAKKGMMFPALGKGLLPDAEKKKKGGKAGFVIPPIPGLKNKKGGLSLPAIPTGVPKPSSKNQKAIGNFLKGKAKDLSNPFAALAKASAGNLADTARQALADKKIMDGGLPSIPVSGGGGGGGGGGGAINGIDQGALAGAAGLAGAVGAGAGLAGAAAGVGDGGLPKLPSLPSLPGTAAAPNAAAIAAGGAADGAVGGAAGGAARGVPSATNLPNVEPSKTNTPPKSATHLPNALPKLTPSTIHSPSNNNPSQQSGTSPPKKSSSSPKRPSSTVDIQNAMGLPPSGWPVKNPTPLPPFKDATESGCTPELALPRWDFDTTNVRVKRTKTFHGKPCAKTSEEMDTNGKKKEEELQHDSNGKKKEEELKHDSNGNVLPVQSATSESLASPESLEKMNKDEKSEISEKSEKSKRSKTSASNPSRNPSHPNPDSSKSESGSGINSNAKANSPPPPAKGSPPTDKEIKAACAGSGPMAAIACSSMMAARTASTNAKETEQAANEGDIQGAMDKASTTETAGGSGEGGGALPPLPSDNGGDEDSTKDNANADDEKANANKKGPLGGGDDGGGDGGGKGKPSDGEKKGGTPFLAAVVALTTSKEQKKGGMLIDAKGANDMKDGHDDGTMRGAEEVQRNEPITGVGQPFSAGEFRRLRRRRRRLLETRKKGYRTRSLLMLDETPENIKLLDPNSLIGTPEDPFAPQNVPYVDPRIIGSKDETKDASNGEMYNNPDSILVTQMTVCINEDNAALAKALFLNIASKDVEVECKMLGT